MDQTGQFEIQTTFSEYLPLIIKLIGRELIKRGFVIWVTCTLKTTPMYTIHIEGTDFQIYYNNGMIWCTDKTKEIYSAIIP